jgi:diketogulonate reductase-like aldo/keto reductase
VQTKFTWTSGQDLGTQPFDADAPISLQVRQSIESSLFNLRPRSDKESAPESYIDCVLLHFPLPTLEQTLQVWTTLQAYCPSKIRRLGISNTSLPIVQVLLMAKSVTINPSVVQNRLYAETGYDKELRDFCEMNDVEYQCFGVLKSNLELLQDDCVVGLSSDAQVSPESAFYFLVLDLGNVTILNGTKRPERMRKDLEELQRLESWMAAPTNEGLMEQLYRPRFRSLLHQKVQG